MNAFTDNNIFIDNNAVRLIIKIIDEGIKTYPIQ